MDFVSDDNDSSLTPQGFKRISTIWTFVADKNGKTVIRMKKTYNRMTFAQLISYVYDHYSKFTKNQPC